MIDLVYVTHIEAFKYSVLQSFRLNGNVPMVLGVRVDRRGARVKHLASPGIDYFDR